MEPSEYLSPRDLGRAVGLSESSVRRWADDGRLRAERTAGGHRRISRAEAVRFVREAGLPLLRPDLLGFPGGRSAVAGLVPEAEALAEALRSADAGAARRMLVSAFLEGAPLASLCDGPIRGALRELGHLWRHGPQGIVHEHRAVDTCLHALMDIRGAIPDRAGAPVAMGGAVEGDPYVLPTVMSAVVLADVGFRALNLGADVPSPALIAAARLYSPVLVWRSDSGAGSTRSLGREARLFWAMPERDRPALVVGGRGLSPAELPRVGIQYLHSMAELTGFARAVLSRFPNA